MATFIIFCIIGILLIIYLIILTYKEHKKTEELLRRYNELSEMSRTMDKMLYDNYKYKLKTIIEVKKKYKKHNQKGDHMSKYDTKLASLAKQLGDSYKLSLEDGKKGNINLVVKYSNEEYKIKFNSRKFNETSNNSIIKKIKSKVSKKETSEE